MLPRESAPAFAIPNGCRGLLRPEYGLLPTACQTCSDCSARAVWILRHDRGALADRRGNALGRASPATSPMANTPGQLVSSGKAFLPRAISQSLAKSSPGHPRAFAARLLNAILEPAGIGIGADEQEDVTQGLLCVAPVSR